MNAPAECRGGRGARGPRRAGVPRRRGGRSRVATTAEVLQAMSDSKPIEVFLTIVIHAIYAAVLALSLVVSVWVAVALLPPLVGPLVCGEVLLASWMGIRNLFLCAGACALMLYSYLFTGVLVQAGAVRLLSLGVKPGRYPAVSLTTLRWLIYSGIFTISMRTIFPIIPVTFLLNLYFQIQGCRMGKKVRINSPSITDAYLLTLGDNVVVGGMADISCHLFEGDHLILARVVIGADTLIGSHAYISPGVTIGKRCTIGLFSYIRRGKTIPDGTVTTSVAATDVRTARKIERGSEHA